MSQLFDIDVSPAETENLSADRKRTLRRNAKLAQGLHPSGLGPISDEGTCGTCVHHIVVKMGHTFHKCELTQTGSAATDIRIGWPACPKYLPTPFGEGPWPDAYRP